MSFEFCFFEKVEECVGCDDECLGDWEICVEHFAEVGAFASGELEVFFRKVGEPFDVVVTHTNS